MDSQFTGVITSTSKKHLRGDTPEATWEHNSRNASIKKSAVFWDIKTQFVPHGKHITSLLQSPAG
jgi:hypothetical protein